MNLLAVETVGTWPEILEKTGIGIGVVFSALIALVFMFKAFSFIMNFKFKTKVKDGEVVTKITTKEQLEGETAAAIAMAITAYFNEMHDEESNVITIKRLEKRYSPWNSKIYGINNLNR